MTIEAQLYQEGCSIEFTADASYTAGEMIQLPDGRAGVVKEDVTSGNIGVCYVGGIFLMQKTTSMVLLQGGRAFWDHSVNKVYFRKINDRDFYAGRVLSDAASAATR